MGNLLSYRDWALWQAPILPQEFVHLFSLIHHHRLVPSQQSEHSELCCDYVFVSCSRNQHHFSSGFYPQRTLFFVLIAEHSDLSWMYIRFVSDNLPSHCPRPGIFLSWFRISVLVQKQYFLIVTWHSVTSSRWQSNHPATEFCHRPGAFLSST